MPQVSFPTLTSPYDERYTNFDVAPFNPDQESQTSPYTGAVSIFNRSPGRWRGNLAIGQMDDEEQAGLVEGFIASLKGLENWARLPFGRATLSTGITISGITPASDTVEIAAASVVRAGQYARVGSRVVIVRGRPNDTSLVLWPYIPAITVGTILQPATHILARITNTHQLTMPRDSDFYGPWALQWIENI